MAEDEKPRNKGGRPRKHPVGSRVPTLAFRVRAGLRDRLAQAAEQRERSISEEIEARLERSFMDEQVIADLRSQLAVYGTDPHEIAAVQAFAGLLRAIQKRHGKSWREGDCIPWVVTEAMRRLMVSQTRSPLFEGLAPFGRTAEVEAEAGAVGDLARDVFTFPALPELAPQDDPQNWTGAGRLVVTFKDKATGEVLEVVTAREGPWDRLANLPSSPAFLAAIEKYRPRRDEIEVEDAFVHVLKSEKSVWDLAEAVTVSPPAVYLTGPEEAEFLMAGQPSAIRNHPAELHDRALFDEIMSDRPRDDGDGDASKPQGGSPGDGETPVSAPARRRKAKVKA